MRHVDQYFQGQKFVAIFGGTPAYSGLNAGLETPWITKLLSREQREKWAKENCATDFVCITYLAHSKTVQLISKSFFKKTHEETSSVFYFRTLAL